MPAAVHDREIAPDFSKSLVLTPSYGAQYVRPAGRRFSVGSEFKIFAMMPRFLQASTFVLLSFLGISNAQAQSATMSAEAINAANLITYVAEAAVGLDVIQVASSAPVSAGKLTADPALARLQILLDRAGASPGVIDGLHGSNLEKALRAFQLMHDLPADGKLTFAVAARLEAAGPAISTYTITAQDLSSLSGPIPSDYAEKAAMAHLGYESVAEQIAERFHMDIGLITALNPYASFAVGEVINVAVIGAKRKGTVAWIEADKALKQVRVYGLDGILLAAYPATIGSADNPSPSGTHTVTRATTMPGYTYNPKINFQQGDNTGVLTIPPGPNGPVGTVWIGLSKPSFGIHGTPEPSMIGKSGSHGCIRLTNWDAEELAAMVTPGVTVDFI